MKLFLLLVIFAGVFVFEVPGLVYRKYWKELIVFLVFLGFSVLISLLAVLGVPLPSPARGIETVVTYVISLITTK